MSTVRLASGRATSFGYVPNVKDELDKSRVPEPET